MTNIKKKKLILITGTAGFIGFHTAKYFLKKNYNIIGVDNYDKYYDVKLKKSRTELLIKNFKKKFIFKKFDLNNTKEFEQLFKNYRFTCIIHLAANPGIRFSILKPKKVFKNNISLFFNLLTLAEKYKIKNIIYASTSSVYGNLSKEIFKEKDINNTPLQLYSASKLTNELIAYVFSAVYKINIIGLRFFTVYGPWGRPDMSYFKFVDSILKYKHIDFYNYGKHQRDFTYIDDIVDGIYKSYNSIPKIFKKNIKNEIPHRVFNLGNTKSISLKEMITEIEKLLGKKAKIKFLPKQKGDMIKTKSDITNAKRILLYKPKVNFKVGIKKFINWYRDYYNINNV